MNSLTVNGIKLCRSCNREKPLSEFPIKWNGNKPSYGRCHLCTLQYDYNRRREKGIPVKTIPKVVIPNQRVKKSYLVRLREDYPIVVCTCNECNVVFNGTKRRKFCNKKCLDKYYRRIRHRNNRARIRTLKVDNVDPIKVFETYQWHCACCNTYTPRHLKGKHNGNSPELDHIIPLSLGGEHSYINTQLLCRLCNGLKSNKLINQQSIA